MFVGFTGTFLKNGGQPLLYQYTKNETNNPDNYRGISLLNTRYKIYSKIIAKRLRVIADILLLEEQYGFRKGRSRMDFIFPASQIIEKHREFNIPTYIAFIDFKKHLNLWTETNYGLSCQAKEF
jgi:hypothetical protein